MTPPDNATSTTERSAELPRHKTALLIWVAVFPTVFVLSTLLSHLPFQLPQLLSTFIVTAVAIPLVVYVWVPALLRLLGLWIHRASTL